MRFFGLGEPKMSLLALGGIVADKKQQEKCTCATNSGRESKIAHGAGHRQQVQTVQTPKTPKRPKVRPRISKMWPPTPPPQPIPFRNGHFLEISKRYNIPPPPPRSDIFEKNGEN